MQVNRSNSTPYAAPAAATAAPPGSARDDRRAVKQIACSIESDLKKLGCLGHLSTDLEKLARIRDRVGASQEQLAALRAKGLDHNAPQHSGLRRARSAVVLGGGMVGRGAAIVGATAAGVVEGGVVAVACPVAGVVSGAHSGLDSGAHMFGGYTWPVTAPIGAAAGAALGGVSGLFSAGFAAALKVALKGSYTRRTFTALDQYSKARAHVAKKKMSTREIADAAAARASTAQSQVQEQYQQAEFFAGVPAMMRNMAEELVENLADALHSPSSSASGSASGSPLAQSSHS